MALPLAACTPAAASSPVRNGRFSDPLNGSWEEFYESGHETVVCPIRERLPDGTVLTGDDIKTVHLVTDRVYDPDSPSPPWALEIGSELPCGPSLHREIGVRQPVREDVSRYARALLSFWVKPLHASVPYAGQDGTENAGVTVAGFSNGKPWSHRAGVIYDSPERDSQVRYYMDRWGPAAPANRGKSATVARNRWHYVELDLKALPGTGAPDHISLVSVSVKGWDARARFDNVSLRLV